MPLHNSKSVVLLYYLYLYCGLVVSDCTHETDNVGVEFQVELYICIKKCPLPIVSSAY